MNKGKGLIRSLNRSGTRSNKKPAVAKQLGQVHEPTMCERCGAVFARQTWRRNRRMSLAVLDTASWTICPGCQQAAQGEYFGRVLIGGAYAAANEPVIRQRIHNVDERAQFTQPERRVLSVTRDGGVLEVLTTSQKLAHRIVRELKKAFRGRAVYHWSEEDGSLVASWRRDDVGSTRASARAGSARR